MIINSKKDAQTLVLNSGYCEWEFKSERWTDSEIIEDELPLFVYHSWDNDSEEDSSRQLKDIVIDFIDIKLEKNPKDYF